MDGDVPAPHREVTVPPTWIPGSVTGGWQLGWVGTRQRRFQRLQGGVSAR